MALVNAGRLANKSHNCSWGKRTSSASFDIAKQLRLSEPRVLDIIPDDQYDPYYSWRKAHLLPDDRPVNPFYVYLGVLTPCAIDGDVNLNGKLFRTYVV